MKPVARLLAAGMALWVLPVWGDAPRVAAYVGKEVITEKDLRMEVESRPEARALEETFRGEDLAERRRNMEAGILDQMITRRLVVREARKLLKEMDQGLLAARIAREVSFRGLEDEEQLRRALQDEGVTWEKFKTRMEDEILVFQYEHYKTRRKDFISPEAVRLFYERHKDAAAVEHRSVDGLLRRVEMRTPDTARVRHLIIRPADTKGLTVADLPRVHGLGAKLNEEFPATASLDDVAAWATEAVKRYPEVDVTLVMDEEFGADVLEDAMNQPEGVWGPAKQTLIPTRAQGVELERWDRFMVIERRPGRLRPLREVQEEIERYLSDGARDRELGILKERLWKKGAVRVLYGSTG
ncbi:MAG: SurA N-terminal domain-containing protein [Planctomycetota bacterium]